ncbi:hypothetical protein [Streptomyces sp. NPDC057718]|uniref:hypothetical protein n=1 Tax=Streptomyces sp. NPDC057718 TaxID=3346225 RepID=UPI00367FA4E6
MRLILLFPQVGVGLFASSGDMIRSYRAAEKAAERDSCRTSGERVRPVVPDGEDGDMSDWGVALIAAGSAVAGSVVTGWYARSAGIRQADAARQAGDRQADALLESVRMTLSAESGHREYARRRQIYAEFLGAAESRILAERNGRGQANDDDVLHRALSGVLLEGPPPVVAAAQHIVDCLRRHEKPDELKRAKLAFVSVAQECCQSR